MKGMKLTSMDPEIETERIVTFLQETVHKKMRRFGAIVGISGGIDSSVILALCVRALGPKHVLAISLPEDDSHPDTIEIARMLANHYSVDYKEVNITSALRALGCYDLRDKAIKELFPEYDLNHGYTCKIVLPPDSLDNEVLNYFTLTIFDPQNNRKSTRLPIREYLKIVAATNMKQRTRMIHLYYFAELNNYVVVGTTNKDENDLGFFVKYGDGGVDIEPIAHLYKTEVFKLAEYLDVPEIIRNRPPSTDTYSAHSTQQEFFYRLPFELLDTLMYGLEKSIPIDEISVITGLSEIQIEHAWSDLRRKKQGTSYLRMDPVTLHQK